MASSAVRTTAVRTTKARTTKVRTTDWSSRGTLTGITLGTLNLGATFKCMDIELQFAEAGGTIARAYAQVRALNAASAVVTTVDLWPTRLAASQFAFYGVCFDRMPGTTYDVRVTAIDALGNRAVKSGSITTRAETIADLSTLVATRFVRTDGSDSNDGSADDAAHAWATLDKAWTVSNTTANLVVQVGPGVFVKTPEASLTSPTQRTSSTNVVTFVAQYPALDADRNRINAGNETFVVQPNTSRTSPTGSGGPNAGAWAKAESLIGSGNTGAPAGADYGGSGGLIWKWASGITTNQPTTMQMSTTETGTMTQVAPWVRDAGNLSTAAGWAEKLETNQIYRYGWWISATGDVYLRVPNDTDPNTVWLSFATAFAAFASTAPDVRFSGMVFRGFNPAVEVLNNSAKRNILDRCVIEGFGNNNGWHNRGSTSPASPVATNVGADHIIQDCIFQNRGLRMPSGAVPDATIIPWTFIKSSLVNADGTSYSPSKTGGALEGGSTGGRNSHFRTVVRRTTADGTHNGFNVGTQAATPRYWGYGFELDTCLAKNIQDDGMEPEGVSINWKAVDSRTEYSLTAFSAGPTHYGPQYLVRCQFWRYGTDGEGLRVGNGAPGITGTAIKYGSSSSPQARIFILHCTGWSDSNLVIPGGVVASNNVEDFAGGSVTDESIYLVNSIFRSTGVAVTPNRSTNQVEQYNLLATADSTSGARTKSLTGVITLYQIPAAWRAGTGYGTGTNVVGGADQPFNSAAWLDALLTDPENGDLTLKAGTAVVGTPIPGISDNLGRSPKPGYQP